MLNINNDYNLSMYFEFFVNYLNQFDVSTLDKNELLLFNDLFFKNFLSIFFILEFLKIFIYFNNKLMINIFDFNHKYDRNGNDLLFIASVHCSISGLEMGDEKYKNKF